MPLIKVHTSANTLVKNDVEALLKDLSKTLAQHLGKPESYVMTAFGSGLPMTFAGTIEPTCYIEIKSVGTMGSPKTQAMSQNFCSKVQTALGVPPNRTYIDFSDSQGVMWGWNSSTFSELFVINIPETSQSKSIAIKRTGNSPIFSSAMLKHHVFHRVLDKADS